MAAQRHGKGGEAPRKVITVRVPEGKPSVVDAAGTLVGLLLAISEGGGTTTPHGDGAALGEVRFPAGSRSYTRESDKDYLAKRQHYEWLHYV